MKTAFQKTNIRPTVKHGAGSKIVRAALLLQDLDVHDFCSTRKS